ncbi:hypothetical protein [Alistipes onderdonkii]|jgi:hypothetical protein|uniref:hypothetical protein n=1 Tax=Alistipes onderdonkii TaxID=328813 RepID=UPI0034A576C1
MQKIMFNDRYVLTDAVIEGRKTVTRRIIYGIDFPVNMVMGRVLPDKEGKIYAVANGENIIVKLRYKVGEVVAVAQSYNEATREFPHLATTLVGHDILGSELGCTNKMFVRADLMPHQIRITRIRCERLQDISDAECMKEGVRVEFAKNGRPMYYYFDIKRWRQVWFDTPREAFASLIDKVSGRGTWDRNPWVVVYEFELVK